MAGLTAEQAEARLSAWLAADAAVARGQAYTVEGRSVTRADAEQIRQNIEFWDRKVKQLANGSSGGNRVRHGVLIT